MHTCALCNIRFEADSPAILYVDRYSRKRPLCAACEALLDAATAEDDTAARKEALQALSAISLKMKDPESMQVLRDVIDGKTSAEETEQDIADEEEWKEIQQEETETEQKSLIFDYILPCVVGVVAIGFMVWFCFFR